jgi:protein SCO1/2
MTYCYHYDPMLNRHSLIVARVVQLGAMVTVFCLGGYMIVMFRRDRKKAKATPVPNWKNVIG